MYIRIEKRSTGRKKQKLMIFTSRKGASEHAGGAVSHIVGSAEVTIRSNVHSWGSVPVCRRDKLRLLRDALVRICEWEGIK